MRLRAFMAGAAVSLSVAAAAMGQQSTSRPFSREGGRANLDRMGSGLLDRSQTAVNSLGLTDDQKTKIDAIFKKAHEDFDGMRKDLEGMEPRQRVQQLQDFFKSVYQDIGAELTEAQRTEMQKKLEQLRPNRNGGGGRFGGNGLTGAGTQPTKPTSEPAQERAFSGRATTSPGGNDGAARLERLRANLAKLELTDDEKTKIKAMLDDIRTRAQSLRQEAQNGSEEAKEKLRGLSGEVREKLMDILTPEQLEKLHDLTTADGPPPRNPSPTSAPAMNDKSMNEPAMRDSDTASNSKSNTDSKPAAAPAPKPAVAGPAIGDPSPQVALKKIDGSQFQLSSLKGRVIVLEFGSYTSPAFRERVGPMEKLKTEYGQRAQFFVVYQSEAHAKGEWEVDRNKDKDIVVDQPKTLEARSDLAKKARQDLKITVPILVDTIGNETATAFGAGANSAFVINRDGVIVAHQQWFDPGGLHGAIDEAIKALPTTKPSASPVAAN